jgi:hypothetical protein
MSTPCPFCRLGSGFHDDDVHAATPIPAGKLQPTSAAQARARATVCRNCGAGYDEPAVPPCRNPRHEAAA